MQRMAERLDKFLASQGEGSRKDVGKWIRGGRVTVNGVPVRDPGSKVEPESDVVEVGGRPVSYQKHVYVMMHKPKGVLSATEDARASTVLDLLPEELRRRGLFPAGRLDKDTTGLLLLTDDGALAHRMLAPKSHVYKLYRAQLDAPLTREDCQAFREGISWGEERYAPARLSWEEGNPRIGLVEIHEGRVHQVKRMFQAVGKQVLELERLRIGGLELDPPLQEGQYRQLEDAEISQIFTQQNTRKQK